MKTLILLVTLMFSAPSFARDTTILDYIEKVSDSLKIPISASSMAGGDFFRISSDALAHPTISHLSTLLWLNGFTMISDPELGGYQLMRTRDARDSHTPVIVDASKLEDQDVLVTHIISLNYFSADGLARILRNLGPAGTRFSSNEGSKTLTVVDSSRAIRGYRDLIAKIDTQKGADEAKEVLKSYRKPEICAHADSESGDHSTALFIIIGLLGVLFGLLARGYLIRRVEGGL